MKNQQVGVDFAAMAKAMLTYGAVTALCWLMLRLFGAVFSFPQRIRAQQYQIHNSLQELQRRFPDLNITEEELKNAEKELDELTQDFKNKENSAEPIEKKEIVDESKKTI